MKTEAIKESIVQHFQTIAKKSKVTPEKEHVVSTWGLVYKNKCTRGFVNELGTIERNGTKIDIKEGEIKQVKKPFYVTWKYALKGINNMLGKMEENLDNEKMVTKKVVNILCFPASLVEKLSGISKKRP